MDELYKDQFESNPIPTERQKDKAIERLMLEAIFKKVYTMTDEQKKSSIMT